MEEDDEDGWAGERGGPALRGTMSWLTGTGIQAVPRCVTGLAARGGRPPSIAVDVAVGLLPLSLSSEGGDGDDVVAFEVFPPPAALEQEGEGSGGVEIKEEEEEEEEAGPEGEAEL